MYNQHNLHEMGEFNRRHHQLIKDHHQHQLNRRLRMHHHRLHWLLYGDVHYLHHHNHLENVRRYQLIEDLCHQQYYQKAKNLIHVKSYHHNHPEQNQRYLQHKNHQPLKVVGHFTLLLNFHHLVVLSLLQKYIHQHVLLIYQP
ncbi:hypothetical protein C2G38_676988 [Gigaspora rosea]|uniref:Uncharacterized protein n=1 Tax=Gigaspora rosea TaxID=44941 RepID=A0A397U2K1_9GLOM|nr:hypothetical protein C2G38_676988 [Gigaspora rosea]